MRAEEKVEFAGKLLELISQLKDLVVDYCRILTYGDDGSMSEKDIEEKSPF